MEISVSAQRIQPPTAQSTANYNKTIKLVKPQIRTYVNQTASTLSRQRFNADSLRQTLTTAGVPGSPNLSQTDVSTLMLMVMQATEAEEYRILRGLQADMERNNQKKKALRKEEETITGNRKTADSTKRVLKVYPADVSKRLVAIQQEKDKLDEMEQDEMLMLQQMMEEKSRLETMISNVLKSQGDSAEISRNLKAS